MTSKVQLLEYLLAIGVLTLIVQYSRTTCDVRPFIVQDSDTTVIVRRHGSKPVPTEYVAKKVPRPNCTRILATNKTKISAQLPSMEFVCNGTAADYVPSQYASILTLFTTMVYSREKANIFNNTLHMLPHILHNTTLVLFMEIHKDKETGAYASNPLATTACRLGWLVFRTPICNTFGYPVLKYMFEVVLQNFNSKWYGYANGDIIFANGLEETLNTLWKERETVNVSLVTGIRHNVGMNPAHTVRNEKDLEKLTNRAVPHVVCSADYFITQKDIFPWDDLPPFVIGRAGYDNWLLYFTYLHNITALDASDTIMSLHQSLRGNPHEHNKMTAGDRYNIDMVPKWNAGLGFLTNIAFKLVKSQQTYFFLQREMEKSKKNKYPGCLGTLSFKVKHTTVIHQSKIS